MSEQLRFIPLAEVSSITGLGRTAIYSIPDFPKPIKVLGPTSPTQGGSRWVHAEIIQWMQSRILQRDAQQEIAKVNKSSGFPYLRSKQSLAGSHKSVS